jgi:hypothetical protein
MINEILNLWWDIPDMRPGQKLRNILKIEPDEQVMVIMDLHRKLYRGRLVDCSHLVSNDLDALHKVAAHLNLSRSSFQNKEGKHHPHYDLIGYRIAQGLEIVPFVHSKTIVEFINDFFKPKQYQLL